jgi:hypothetical protein
MRAQAVLLLLLLAAGTSADSGDATAAEEFAGASSTHSVTNVAQ